MKSVPLAAALLLSLSLPSFAQKTVTGPRGTSRNGAATHATPQ